MTRQIRFFRRALASVRVSATVSSSLCAKPCPEKDSSMARWPFGSREPMGFCRCKRSRRGVLRRWLPLALLGPAALLSPAAVAEGPIRVPQDLPDLQSAVESAQPGQVILLDR